MNTTDLFATVAEIAGAPLPEVPLDSVSLVPYLDSPSQPPLRTEVFAEIIAATGITGLAPGEAERAMRDDRYKLIQDLDGDELYDLWQDPFEQQNLLQGILTPEQQAVYEALEEGIASLVGS